jgi:hypothetical protein
MNANKSIMDKHERLPELKNTAYNAEDELAGIYNSEEYPDLIDVNNLFNNILINLNKLVKMLDSKII